MKIADEIVMEKEYIQKSNEQIFSHIKRADELVKRVPESKKMFQDYIKQQADENELHLGHVNCTILYLKNVCEKNGAKQPFS